VGSPGDWENFLVYILSALNMVKNDLPEVGEGTKGEKENLKGFYAVG
jgi:hypothetical protein